MTPAVVGPPMPFTLLAVCINSILALLVDVQCGLLTPYSLTCLQSAVKEGQEMLAQPGQDESEQGVAESFLGEEESELAENEAPEEHAEDFDGPVVQATTLDPKVSSWQSGAVRLCLGQAFQHLELPSCLSGCCAVCCHRMLCCYNL